MTEADLKMLKAQFERLRRECNTPEKAIAQLQREGIYDETGNLAAKYRDDGGEAVWE